MNWIFKDGGNLNFEKDGQIATLQLEQKRLFSGKEGEDVLILKNTHEGWMFTAHYKIESVKVENPEAETKSITVDIRLVDDFKDKLLDDYVYSLLRITNYSNPIKHFNRKYNRLFDVEYNAIVQEKIYTKRSIFGTIVNALHLTHRMAFIEYVSINNPKLLLRNADLDEALSLLLKYLAFAVIHPSILLTESVKLLQSIISTDDTSEMGFGDSSENFKSNDVQLLKPQVEIINEFMPELEFLNEDFFFSIIKDNNQWNFKNLFRNTPLPISLN